ncbi:MAG: hypothetical protein JWM90_1680 [Thermoleophilia bacterium]|nr:hypothetical protein [Thermoleophilia bacterium]
MHVAPSPTAATAAAAAAAPRPLPGTTLPPAADVARWTTAPVAETTYTTTDRKGRTKDETFTSVTFPDFISLELVDGTLANFAEAVAIATAYSNRMTGTRGADSVTHSAMAVLQASDGAYYLTTLQDPRGGATTITPWEKPSFGRPLPQVTVTARALDPSLKALVGATNWINFSDEQIVAQLAG